MSASRMMKKLVAISEELFPWVITLCGEEANPRIITFDDKGDVGIVFDLPPVDISGRVFYTIQGLLKYDVYNDQWNVVLIDAYGERKPNDARHPHDQGLSFCMDERPLEESANEGKWNEVVMGLLAQSASYNPDDSIRTPSGIDMCAACGGSENEMEECNSCDANVCTETDCSKYCEGCDRFLCDSCFGNDDYECSSCFARSDCEVCGESRYTEDLHSCNTCSESVCSHCYIGCRKCGDYMCEDCMTDDGGSRSERICLSCRENKCGACGRFVSHYDYLGSCNECGTEELCDYCLSDGDCEDCTLAREIECDICGIEHPQASMRQIGVYDSVCDTCGTIGIMEAAI